MFLVFSVFNVLKNPICLFLSESDSDMNIPSPFNNNTLPRTDCKSSSTILFIVFFVSSEADEMNYYYYCYYFYFIIIFIIISVKMKTEINWDFFVKYFYRLFNYVHF